MRFVGMQCRCACLSATVYSSECIPSFSFLHQAEQGKLNDMGITRTTQLSSDPGPSGESSPSTSSPSGNGLRSFPLAAQPEIMRAAEKDDQYASFVYDACRDAFRHLFGPFSSPFSISTNYLYTAENLIPHSLDFVIGTRVAVAYQSEVEQISIIYDWKDLSFWSDDDEFRFMALFLFVFADKASWADALLRINNRFRAANPRRRVLWHYSGFYAIDLAACWLRIKF